jgi:glycosyltransferase involved in cell wall biosynthesis
MNHSLTIVIPYYKLRYFEAALESLARQTDKKFSVFIGDDGSPENPAALIAKFRDRLEISYRRFSENLGHRSLTEHWNRCVRETSSEWVWLFSDDDVASADCVEVFKKSLAAAQNACDVFRFNTKVMDDREKIIHQPPPHPAWETSEKFALAKIADGRNSCAIEYIFRRQVFDAAGGFVDFPLAWCSDDASWIAFSRRTGIRTMTGGEVLWRQSDLNLSSPNPKNSGKKLAAWRSYFLWVKKEFRDPVFQKEFRGKLKTWFPLWLGWSGEKPDPMSGLKFWFFFSIYTRHINFKLLRRLFFAASS